jgi:hypothetical protein
MGLFGIRYGLSLQTASLMLITFFERTVWRRVFAGMRVIYVTALNKTYAPARLLPADMFSPAWWLIKPAVLHIGLMGFELTRGLEGGRISFGIAPVLRYAVRRNTVRSAHQDIRRLYGEFVTGNLARR